MIVYYSRLTDYAIYVIRSHDGIIDTLSGYFYIPFIHADAYTVCSTLILECKGIVAA